MIKFTGDFKKLKSMGFTFHKLFARNYKVYEKNKVWIWVAHGGYVEIGDHYDNSKYIAKMILDGTYPVYEEEVKTDFFILEKGRPIPCKINEETGEIINTPKLMRSCGGHDKFLEMENCDDYRDVSLLKKTMDTIKEIKDMIEITVDK